MSLLTTAPLKIWPPAAAGIIVTSGPSNSVLGAWTEIVPANTISAALAVAGLRIINIGDNLEIQFGTGIAGSEAPISKPLLVSASGTNLGLQTWMLQTPIGNIPANARLSMRTRSVGGNVSYRFTLLYYDALDPDLATIVPYFYAPYSTGSTTPGAANTPSATPWALSPAWSELHPGLPAGTQIMGAAATWPGSAYDGVEFEIVLGTGVAASEVAITSIPGIYSAGTGNGFMDFWLPQAYTLQTAARVSYKVRKSGTTTTAFHAFLIGLLAQPSPPEPPEPPPNPPTVTSLDLNCDLNQLGINGTNFTEGMDIAVQGPSGQDLAFSVLTFAPTRIVLTIEGFDVTSGVYCVDLTL